MVPFWMFIKLSFIRACESFLRFLLFLLPAPYMLHGGKRLILTDAAATRLEMETRFKLANPDIFKAMPPSRVVRPFARLRKLTLRVLEGCYVRIEHLKADGFMYIITGCVDRKGVMRAYRCWSRIAFGDRALPQGWLSLDAIGDSIHDDEDEIEHRKKRLVALNRARKRLISAPGAVAYDMARDRVVTAADDIADVPRGPVSGRMAP